MAVSKHKNKKVSRPRVNLKDHMIVKEIIKDDLEKAEKRAYDKAVKETTEFCSALVQVYSNMVLLDKFGFDSKNLKKFNDEVSSLSDSVNDSYTYIKSIVEAVEQEGGVVIPKIIKDYIDKGFIESEE